MNKKDKKGQLNLLPSIKENMIQKKIILCGLNLIKIKI